MKIIKGDFSILNRIPYTTEFLVEENSEMENLILSDDVVNEKFTQMINSKPYGRDGFPDETGKSIAEQIGNYKRKITIKIELESYEP